MEANALTFSVCCFNHDVCMCLDVFPHEHRLSKWLPPKSNEWFTLQDPWPPTNVTALAQRSARWLVTRGEHGADEVTAAGTVSLPAEKVWSAEPADPSSLTSANYM